MSAAVPALVEAVLRRKADFEHTRVILPTRRAAASLRKALVERCEGSGMLPRFTTLAEYMSEITHLQPADTLELYWHAYRAYSAEMGDRAQLPEAFSTWVDTMLADFDSIAAQLIKPGELFRQLSDYAELEHLSFSASVLSESQEKYQLFWKALPRIYTRWVDSLLNEGIATPGIIAQKAAGLWSPGSEYIIAAGFNALSASEAQLLSRIESAGCGVLYWDADQWYMDDPVMHAGHFLRKFEQRGLGSLLFTPQGLHQRPLHITVHSVSQRQEQALQVAALLQQVPEEKRASTAVVLPDASLLIPLLEAMPAAVGEINVTMGLSLRDSIFLQWLQHLFACTEGSNPGKVWMEAWKRFTSHPLTQVAGAPPVSSLSSSQELSLVLPHADTPWLQALKAYVLGPASFESGLTSLLNAWSASINSAEVHPLEWAQISRGVHLAGQALRSLQHSDYQVNMSAAQKQRYLLAMLRQAKLHLLGDPKGGIQIMGLLETRGLAFEQVIICDMVEETLPRRSGHQSLIPLDIAKYHQMPGQREREAAQAYHFYRLCQHAEHIHLLTYGYSAGGPAESSRYIDQLQEELLPASQQVTFSRKRYAPEPGMAAASENKLPKNERILRQIEDHLTTKGISLSSLARYIDDPLEWYYEYVLRLKPVKKDELDPADLGTVVHECLKKLFIPYLTNPLLPIHCEEMLRRAGPALRETFATELGSVNLDQGYPHLHFTKALEMVVNLIRDDRDRLELQQLTVIALEEKFTASFELQHQGRELRIPISGIIDRKERRDGALWIIDYKSGKIDSKDVKLKADEGFDRDTFKGRSKLLQLLLYLYAHGQSGERASGAQLISLLNPWDRSFAVANVFTQKEVLENFVQFLHTIIREMLDPDQVLAHPKEYRYATLDKD